MNRNGMQLRVITKAEIFRPRTKAISGIVVVYGSYRLIGGISRFYSSRDRTGIDEGPLITLLSGLHVYGPRKRAMNVAMNHIKAILKLSVSSTRAVSDEIKKRGYAIKFRPTIDDPWSMLVVVPVDEHHITKGDLARIIDLRSNRTGVVRKRSREDEYVRKLVNRVYIAPSIGPDFPYIPYQIRKHINSHARTAEIKWKAASTIGAVAGLVTLVGAAKFASTQKKKKKETLTDQHQNTTVNVGDETVSLVMKLEPDEEKRPQDETGLQTAKDEHNICQIDGVRIKNKIEALEKSITELEAELEAKLSKITDDKDSKEYAYETHSFTSKIDKAKEKLAPLHQDLAANQDRTKAAQTKVREIKNFAHQEKLTKAKNAMDSAKVDVDNMLNDMADLDIQAEKQHRQQNHSDMMDTMNQRKELELKLGELQDVYKQARSEFHHLEPTVVKPPVVVAKTDAGGDWSWWSYWEQME